MWQTTERETNFHISHVAVHICLTSLVWLMTLCSSGTTLAELRYTQWCQTVISQTKTMAWQWWLNWIPSKVRGIKRAARLTVNNARLWLRANRRLCVWSGRPAVIQWLTAGPETHGVARRCPPCKQRGRGAEDERETTRVGGMGSVFCVFTLTFESRRDFYPQ